MDEMALAIGEKITLKDDSHVLLTLFTLEEISEALPSPLPVKNVVRLFKPLLENNKLPNFNL